MRERERQTRGQRKIASKAAYNAVICDFKHKAATLARVLVQIPSLCIAEHVCTHDTILQQCCSFILFPRFWGFLGIFGNTQYPAATKSKATASSSMPLMVQFETRTPMPHRTRRNCADTCLARKQEFTSQKIH